MKNLRPITKGLCSLAVLCSASVALAQEYTNILQGFDTPDTVALGVAGSSAVSSVTVLDWSEQGNPGGALLARVPWPNSSGGWQELQLSYDVGSWFGVTIAPYYTVEFDVKVLGNPPKGTDGNYGSVQAVCQGWPGHGLNDGGANWVTLGLVPITTADTWQHITHKLTAFERYNLNRIVFDFVGQNCTNEMTYLIDNIVLAVPTNPPPTVSLGAAPPGGLHLMTSGGAWDRQNIRTVGTNFSWYGASGPVTYSFTVNQYPSSASYAGYQTHIFLIADPPDAANNSADYAAANVLRLDVENYGGGLATLRFKTNSPNGNGGYYTSIASGGGQYPQVPSTTMIGTWKLTLANNTNVTVTTPDGTTSNFVFEAASMFNTPNLRVYFGAQANQTPNIGQEVILSGAQVTGVGGDLSDNFGGSTLDTSKWEVSAAQPGNVFLLPSSYKYHLSWPLPDNLYKFVASPDLMNLTNSTMSTKVSATTRSVDLPPGYPAANAGFFGLAKRAYNKLQVLMPGETAAPGTPTGKSGAPLNQKAGVPFKVTVNAVDDKWNPAFSTDELYLESQPTGDGSGFLWAPQLVHGSYSFTFTNTAAGTFQISAEGKAAPVRTGLGSSYTVDP